MKNNNIAIKLSEIYKKYVLYRNRPSVLGSLLKKDMSSELWTLRGINLEIKKGERIGIIGPNGAGKSTLLKIIVGITKPSSGKISVYGKIVSLMKLDAGFSPELTGAENIRLNSMLIGMNREEIEEKYKQIVSFADIGNFMNSPFYTYSDGMKFRLALAIAISSNAEIIIIDEIFVSGDYQFQQKTIKALRDIQRKRKATTIVTSHIPSFVWAFSNKFYRMEKGILKKISVTKMKEEVHEIDYKWRRSMLLSPKDKPSL